MMRIRRWPFWPVEVPVTVRDGDRTMRLTEIGTIYDSGGSVGAGYTGTSMTLYRGDSSLPPVTCTVKIGKGWLRKKLRSGEWQVEGEGAHHEG